MQHQDREGFFWGIVVSTQDPENRHRVQCRVPDVQGNELAEWAEPDSMILAPLKPGDKVWVRYRGGDTRKPVYHIPYHAVRGFVWNDPAQLVVKNPSGDTMTTGTTSSVVTAGGKVHAMGPDGAGYVPCVASVHEVASHPDLKYDIRPLDLDPLEVIRNAPAMLWKYRPEHAADQRDHIGPLLDRLPDVAKSGSNVDTQALLGIAWEAIARLMDRVEFLEAEIAALNND